MRSAHILFVIGAGTLLLTSCQKEFNQQLTGEWKATYLAADDGSNRLGVDVVSAWWEFTAGERNGGSASYQQSNSFGPQEAEQNPGITLPFTYTTDYTLSCGGTILTFEATDRTTEEEYCIEVLDQRLIMQTHEGVTVSQWERVDQP